MHKKGSNSQSLDGRITTSIAHAAEVLDVGESTVRKLIVAKKLKSVSLGRRRVVTVASLKALAG
jgi:excisionase family DNA binding protein